MVIWWYNGDIYCLNWLHFFRAKNKLESHKKLCENKNVCDVAMPPEDTKVLNFNQYQIFDKTPSISYVDFESLIKKNGWMYK